MGNPLVLEFYRPDPTYLTPNISGVSGAYSAGGSTLIPLNADWAGQNISFAVLDDETFDLGSQLPSVQSVSGLERYGQDSYAYTRGDRQIKFTIMATASGATPSASLKAGVQALQASLNEATQFNVGSNMRGVGPAHGNPLMLKYQPDGMDAIYFWVKSGFVDLAQFDSQINLIQNIAILPITLITTYAGFGLASYLRNLCVNGTFAHGFRYWTNSTFNYINPFNNNTAVSGWNAMYSMDVINGYFPPYTPAAGQLNSAAKYENGSDWAAGWPQYGGNPPTYGFWKGYGTSGQEIIYSQPITINYNSPNDYFWLAGEYWATNQTVNAQISAQWYNPLSTTWSDITTPVTLVNTAAGVWTKFKWSAPQWNFGGGVSGVQFRIKITTDKSNATGVYLALRKISLWYWPAQFITNGILQFTGANYTNPPTTPPSEYVSVGYSSREPMVIYGLQGNLETTARIEVYNPAGGSNLVYQQLNLGAKKATQLDPPFYMAFGGATTFSAGAAYSNVASASANNMVAQLMDMTPQPYKVILRMKSSTDVGLALCQPDTNVAPLFTIVPNASVQAINTGGAIQYVDAGTIYLPPNNMAWYQTPGVGGQPYWLDAVATRLPTSAAGAITLEIYSMWLIPADQFAWIDTRNQSTQMGWINNFSLFAPGSSSHSMGLVIDSMFREQSNIYLETANQVGGVVPLTPAATSAPIRIYPATVTSPGPVVIGGTVRQAGSAGNPTATISETDPLTFGLLYCPAYEV